MPGSGQYAWFLAGLLVGLVLGAGIMAWLFPHKRPGGLPRGNGGVSGWSSIVARIQDLLVVTPSVRAKALEIIRGAAVGHSTVVNDTGVAGYTGYCAPISLYRVNRYHLVLYSNASSDAYLVYNGSRVFLGIVDGRYARWLSVGENGAYSICLEPRRGHASIEVVVEAWPPRNASNDPVFKALAIAWWAAKSLHYVSDPRGLDYVAPPNETLETLSGDCDDFAVLLADMYLSVGLRAGVGLIDTNGDNVPDHAAALVELPYSSRELAWRIPAALQVLGAPYDGYTAIPRGNTTWLVVDPAMAYEGREPWLVTKPYYRVLYFIEPR